jgi:carbamoyl-phosphate synthase small subunit
MSASLCRLGLEDGTVFTGDHFGAAGTAEGEVVFNTAMTGYQEILTDPSYCGQIVTMTAPQIGNYGINREDVESRGTFLSGFVVKELSRRVSNQRATGDLASYLRESGVIGLAGIDTRALTRRLRVLGALRGVLSTEIDDEAALVERAHNLATMNGQNLVARVMPDGGFLVGDPSRGKVVVALDCGIKSNIVKSVAARGHAVHVLRGDAPLEAILELSPAGVLVGNGPGDPAAVSGTIDTLRSLIGRMPVFGICLGQQLLALALGATTYKLKTGHHGANHPVLDVDTGRVEITSQNHGFSVDEASLRPSGARPTHVSLYDRSLEGFAHDDLGLFAVQYHPEAAPGPHDSEYLFLRFLERL